MGDHRLYLGIHRGGTRMTALNPLEVERFTIRENIVHYRRLLAEPNVAQDQVRHALLLRLLAEEVARYERPSQN